MTPFLTGTKVSLRPYMPEDATLVFEWFNDPSVTYFMFTGQRPKTLAQVREVVERDIASHENVVFIVCDRKTGEPIGLTGLYEIDSTALKAEYRIIIGNRKYWSRGCGTEVTELMAYYGFDRLNLYRIYLGFTSENKGAERTYSKVGYVHEGVLRGDIYRNSRYYDSVRMGLLREDYYKNLYPKHEKRFGI